MNIVNDEKSKKNLVEKKIKLPKPSITPVRDRMLCIPIELTDLKTESGLYLPGHVKKGDDINPREQQIGRRIYLVAAIGEDIEKQIPVKRGDTVYPFVPNEAIGYSEALVFDPEVAMNFVVFHPTEIAGYKKNS